MIYSQIVWRVLATATATLLALLVMFFYDAVGYGSGIGWTYEVVVLAYPGVMVLGLIFWHRSTRSRPAASLFRASAWICFLLPALLLTGWTGWVAGFGEVFASTLKHMALTAIPSILLVCAYLIFCHSIRFAWANVVLLAMVVLLQVVVTWRGSATLGEAFSSVSFDDLVIGILIAAVTAAIALLNWLAIRKVSSYTETAPGRYRFVPLWWGLASVALLVAGLSSYAITTRAIHEIGQDASRDWSDTLSTHIETGDLDALRAQLEKRRTGVSIAPKALVTAAISGRTEVMLSLLEAGADIEGETIIDYQTALTTAAAVGNLDMVQTLLEHQADPEHGGGVYIPEEGSYTWITPLSAAVIGSSPDAVEALVSAGATPDLTSGDDVTPLMRAAKLGDIRSVQLLLAAGAEPDRQDRLLGWTALHYAAVFGQEEVYTALLSEGANPNLRDERGLSARDLLKDPKTDD